jgi:hypothetical protein
VLFGGPGGFFPYIGGHWTVPVPDRFLFMRLDNMTFTTENVYLYDNQYVVKTESCHPRYWGMFYRAPERVTHEYAMYESAICLGHQHSADFGHWFLEVLPAYSVIPREILFNSVIVLPEFHDYLVDHLSVLGVHESQLVTGLGVTVFARRLYTAEFTFCGDLVKFLIVSFRNLIIRKLKLGVVAPSRFMLHNRWNMSRAVANWGELVSGIKAKWPNVPWEECPVVIGLRKSAIFFDRVKMLFGVHRSIMANIMFMQPDTSLVSLEMEQWLLSFLWLGAYTGKYITLGRDMKITWRGLTPHVVDVPYVLSLVKHGLEQLKVV